ncbi:BTB/POZ protein, partial [Gautieria morchelliformis]
SEWVRIKSGDDFTFIVPRKAAEASGMLKNMLDPSGGFAEAHSNTCQIQWRAVVTEKVAEYLVYKVQYEKASAKEEIPDFIERIVPELVLEMLTAADYLE